MESFQSSKNAKTVFAPNKLGWAIIIVFILLIVVIPSYYFYNQYQKNQLSQNPNDSANIQAQNLIDKVGMLIELPVNEQPRIATVNDKNQLPLNPFFAKAQNGDKVLIYDIAKKAFLYRPSINKIIEVSAVNIESNSSTPIASASASPSVVPVASPRSTVVPTLGPTPLSTSTPTPTVVPQ